MAVPTSGELSLGKIRQELQTANYGAGPFTSAATSLDDAENGTIATINKCQSTYPLAANPANMSEWYGYDHDAPCNFATASYFFDGGKDDTDELVSSGSLKSSPWNTLQADLQDKWTLSMWVKPDNMFEPNIGDPGYQRGYGLWFIEDQTNGRFAGITYVPQSTTAVYNELQFIIGISGAPTNFRQWNVQLDEPVDNGPITQVKENENWASDNDGDTNANGFINLVFVYDDNQGVDVYKFVVYWNGTLLKANTFVTGGGGSGPTNIVYGGDQFAHFGKGELTESWYGHIAWISYANSFAATQADVDILYNLGDTPTQDDVVNLDSNMILFELGGNVDPQTSFNKSVTLDVITATFTNTIFP